MYSIVGEHKSARHEMAVGREKDTREGRPLGKVFGRFLFRFSTVVNWGWWEYYLLCGMYANRLATS